MIGESEIIWLLGFSYCGEGVKGEYWRGLSPYSFNSYYFTRDFIEILKPVIAGEGGVRPVLDASMFHEMMGVYARRGIHVQLSEERLNDILDESSMGYSVVALPSWSTGVCVIRLEIPLEVEESEVVFLERMIRRRIRGYDPFTFRVRGGRGGEVVKGCELLERVAAGSVASRMGVPAESLNVRVDRDDLYYFSVLQYGGRPIDSGPLHGVLTRTISYAKSSSRDIARMMSEAVEISKGSYIYLGNYSGGAWTAGTWSSYWRGLMGEIALSLYIVRYIALNAYRRVIDRIVKVRRKARREWSLEELEDVMMELGTVLLVSDPSIISSSYKFQHQVYPMFSRATRLADTIRSLEDCLNILRDISYMAFSRRIESVSMKLNYLMLLISLISVLLALI